MPPVDIKIPAVVTAMEIVEREVRELHKRTDKRPR